MSEREGEAVAVSSHLAENQPSNEIEIRPDSPPFLSSLPLLPSPPLPLFDLFFQPKWQLLSWIFGSCGIFTIGRLSAFNLVFAKEQREKRRGYISAGRGRRGRCFSWLPLLPLPPSSLPPSLQFGAPTPSRLVFRCCLAVAIAAG